MSIRLKAPVGLRRIPVTTRSSQAAATRATRAQMKGVLKNLEDAVQQIKKLTPQALRAGLEVIYDQSQIYVPRATGRLAASGEMEVSKFGDRIIGTISYGKGGNPQYAVFVHEMIEVYHEPPTRAKFLQTAIDERTPDAIEKIVEFLKVRN